MDRNIVVSAVQVGDVFQNPRSGTSAVVSVTDLNISYMRRSSRISLSIDAFLSVVTSFTGRKCTSTDLREYLPKVFSTKNGGHDCNCTFLFRVAEKMQLVENGIQGKGTAGNPFYVTFKRTI